MAIYQDFSTLYLALRRGENLREGDRILLQPSEEDDQAERYQVCRGGWLWARDTDHRFSCFTLRRRFGWSVDQLNRLVRLCSQEYNGDLNGIWPVKVTGKEDPMASLNNQILLLFILHNQIGPLTSLDSPRNTPPPPEKLLFPSLGSTPPRGPVISDLHTLSTSCLSGGERLAFRDNLYSWNDMGLLAAFHVRGGTTVFWDASTLEFLTERVNNFPFECPAQLKALAFTFNPEGYFPVPQDILVRLAAFLFIVSNQLTPH